MPASGDFSISPDSGSQWDLRWRTLTSEGRVLKQVVPLGKQEATDSGAGLSVQGGPALGVKRGLSVDSLPFCPPQLPLSLSKNKQTKKEVAERGIQKLTETQPR